MVMHCLSRIKAGARLAIVEDPSLLAGANGDRCIYASSSRVTSSPPAKHHREQFKIPVIGILGR